MPSVIEIPETIEEAPVQHSHETLPPMLEPRRGFITKMIALLANVAPLHKQQSGRLRLCHEELEMPLAREHPYMYITVLTG